ncbi:hypothetical protein GCM10023215_16930 [Pseudonocardia yuanmonensis]|uniref:NB-ARC domain-containing protein n=1 Tax=Pseudonocardia yuanmonensis TaxID=1095914 RepID=A0ABP8WA01_9PSEU
MTGPELDLQVSGPVGTVVQVGRVVLEPTGAPPVEGDALAGREDELAAVLRAVAAGAPGVVLAGGPGLGTTALALAAAARLAGRYPGGVRFVPVTGPDAAPVLRELLRDLGVRAGEVPPSTPHRTALLRTLLAAAPTLLVLDDARSAAQVRALLPGGGSSVLVTTAAPLDELHLDGLAAVAVRGLPPATAAALLPAGAHLDLPTPSPPPGDLMAPGAALLAACHGSPLAVRLLGGACRTPAAALRALPAAPPHDARAAARAAALVALAALPAAEREVLEAVRATGLPLVDPARCAALLPDGVPVGTLLGALLRRGLLSPRPGPGAGPWCALPRAVADVLPAEVPPGEAPAYDGLPGGGPADDVLPCEASSCEVWRGAVLPGERPPADHEDAPRSSIRPAFLSQQAAPPEHPARPADHPVTDPTALTTALLQRLARNAAAQADPATGADALVHLAAAHTRRGDGTPALAAATAALDLADRTGDPVLLGRATHRLAAALAEAADPGTPDGAATALRDARTAYDLAVELLAGRDDAAHAHALADRARLSRRRDRPAEALADLHAALALYRTLGLPADVAAAWQEVAAVERATGNPCRAVAAHRSALAALAEAGDPTAAGWARLAAGLVQVGELPAGAQVDLLAGRLADSPAARSVRELRELDPAAPDWALVAALTGPTGPR